MHRRRPGQTTTGRRTTTGTIYRAVLGQHNFRLHLDCVNCEARNEKKDNVKDEKNKK